MTKNDQMGLERFATDKQIEAAQAAMEAALIRGNMSEAAERRQTLSMLQEARIDMTWKIITTLRKEML